MPRSLTAPTAQLLKDCGWTVATVENWEHYPARFNKQRQLVKASMRTKEGRQTMKQQKPVTDEDCEAAYRRGCHQTIAMLRIYADAENVSVDPLIGTLEKILKTMRSSRKPLPSYLNLAIRELHRRLQPNRNGKA